jgi:hypothetical protein
LSKVVQAQQKQLEEFHANIKQDILGAIAAPFKALGDQLGDKIANKIDETRDWLWSKIYSLVHTGAIVAAIIIAILVGLPLKGFLDWILLGRRKRQA